MATKNCPKCDSPNPVACKKCACGHVFFATRRSANALAAERESAEDISEPTTPQEPEVPRRRTARVTRERPQFYDALQVENQTRRQRELQRRRKASKSDDVDVSAEDAPEKPVASTSSSKRARAESPPAKAAEPPAKKRRGRPPGLTNRKTGRAQILANKPTDAGTKAADSASAPADDEVEMANIHDVPPVKALQMNLVLSDINSRIATSGTRAEDNLPPPVDSDAEEKDVAEGKGEPMDEDDTQVPIKEQSQSPPSKKDLVVKKDKSAEVSEGTEAPAAEQGKDLGEIAEAKIEKGPGEKVGKQESSETDAGVKKEIKTEEKKKPETELEMEVAASKDDIKLMDAKGEKNETEIEKETGSKIDKAGNENSPKEEIKKELPETADPEKIDVQAKEKEPVAALKTEEKPLNDGKVLTDTNGMKKDDKEAADDGEKKNGDVLEKVGGKQESGLTTPADSKESGTAKEICSS